MCFALFGSLNYAFVKSSWFEFVLTRTLRHFYTVVISLILCDFFSPYLPLKAFLGVCSFLCFQAMVLASTRLSLSFSELTPAVSINSSVSS